MGDDFTQQPPSLEGFSPLSQLPSDPPSYLSRFPDMPAPTSPSPSPFSSSPSPSPSSSPSPLPQNEVDPLDFECLPTPEHFSFDDWSLNELEKNFGGGGGGGRGEGEGKEKKK